LQGEGDKRGRCCPDGCGDFLAVRGQNLAAFLSKLHSFTKFLEINLKEPGGVPLSEITGRRSKLKENARPLSRNNDYTVEGDSPWLSESTPT
jgi:hypothetical protein